MNDLGRFRRAWEHHFGKKYAEISLEEISNVTTFEAVHRHPEEVLPSDLYGFNNLEVLNRFDSILHNYKEPHSMPPRYFDSVPNLKFLQMNYNVFSTLPDEIFTPLAKLETLIFKNKLERLPESIFNLPSIKRIEVHAVKVVETEFHRFLTAEQAKDLQDHYGEEIVKITWSERAF